MSLFASPEEHAANPPETWQVVKVTNRQWRLTTKDGVGIASYPRQSDAEQATTSGFYVDLYAKETRWYAGEQVDNWRPYEEVAPHA